MGDLGLQRRHEHPAGSLAGDLVEQGSVDLVSCADSFPTTFSTDAASLRAFGRSVRHCAHFRFALRRQRDVEAAPPFPNRVESFMRRGVDPLFSPCAALALLDADE